MSVHKKLLIITLMTMSLLASVLSLVISATSPATAQVGSSVQLVNVHDTESGERATDSAEQVIVTVTPVSNCNPGNRGAIGSPYTLNADDGTEITGLLATSCDWEIRFAHATGACPVSATPQNSGSEIDTETDGSLTLTSADDATRLWYQSVPVDTINFDILVTGCATTYKARVDITIPITVVNDVSVYRGLEFTVTFTSSREGCNSPVSTTITVPDTVPPGGVIAGEVINLIHQTQADMVGGGTVSNNRCSYNVNFPGQIGSLALQRGFSTSVNGGSGVSAGLTNDAGDSITAVVNATYAPITVPLSLVAVYPDDAVFTTAEKASYSVDVASPCGGYVGNINPNFGVQGAINTVQIFPGSVTIYGESPLQALFPPQSFSVQAYADSAGTQPCTVRVTERQSPERCTTAGGSVQTQTYAAGTKSFSFVFTHTCSTAPPPQPSRVQQPETVPIYLSVFYPSDAVFTTAEKTTYSLEVLAPCTGYSSRNGHRRQFQNDITTFQSFPGYFPIYNSRSDFFGSFSAQTYADSAGTQSCTVKITELDRPEGCTVVGGNTQTQTYYDGRSEFLFEFNHTCRPTISTTTTSTPTANAPAEPVVPASASPSAVVDIEVVSSFPLDKLFTASATVSYGVEVIAPCNGHSENQRDFASVNAFPGSVTVYGRASTQQLIQPRRFTMPAYADLANTQPCSVRVTQLERPQECSATSGNVQSRTYTPRATKMFFEFEHTCDQSSSGGTPLTSTQSPAGITPTNTVGGPLPDATAG